EMVKEVDFQTGINYFEDGDFSSAKRIFEKLGDYSDSPEMIDEIDYQVAVGYLDDGFFDKAISAFEKLGDYSDSKEMVKKAYYTKATNLLYSEEFDLAKDLFVELGDYSSAREMINEVEYRKAQALIKEGRFEKAIEILKNINLYKDSETIRNDLTYEMAVENFNNKHYSTAFYIFSSLIDYKDSKSYISMIEDKKQIANVELIEKFNNLKFFENNFKSHYVLGSEWNKTDELIIVDYVSISSEINVNIGNNTYYLTYPSGAVLQYPSISKDGNKIAFFENGGLKIWDNQNLYSKRYFDVVKNGENVLEWSSDGRLLLIEVEDSTMSVLSFDTETRILNIPFSYHHQISPDSRFLIVQNSDEGKINVWDLDAKVKVAASNDTFDSSPYLIDYSWYDQTFRTFSPDSTYFVTLGKESINIWDMETLTLSKSFAFPNIGAEEVVWSPDGTKIAAESSNGLVVFDFLSGEVESKVVYDYQPSSWYRVKYSQSSDSIVTLSDEGTLYFWSVGTGELLKKIHGVQNYIGWSPNGEKFAFIDQNGNVIIWKFYSE
ncbi:MAG: hypothetical protein KBA03_01230, partial [Anaerolineaceae bacterium]|nr:hypothetical protein [Anaerolineaceae bacterium]